MKKVILITGSTDGIGLETAKELAVLGHKVLIHGRNEQKLTDAKQAIKQLAEDADLASYQADLSSLAQTQEMAQAILQNHSSIDIIINNAGIFNTEVKETSEGLDLRFAVNTIAPYLIVKTLLPVLAHDGRIINLSSAAQAPMNASDLTKPSLLDDSTVYAQSKLALTMWTKALARELSEQQVAVSVNPKSLIGTKMVKQAYGIAGSSLKDGSDILVRAALSDEFVDASGLYFDNDIGMFTSPHSAAMKQQSCEEILQTVKGLCAGN